MSKIKWITKQEVRDYATTPARALDISIRHHQQNVDATEEELPAYCCVTGGNLGADLCGLCSYYKDSFNGCCEECPLGKDGDACHKPESVYQIALRFYKAGTYKKFIKAETALLNRLKQLKSGDKSMDKKQEIQISIKQNEKDQQRLRDEADILQKQLDEAEVTYSIGDKFVCTKTECVLAKIGNKVGLIELPTGKNWGNNNSSHVQNPHCITKGEMGNIWNSSSCRRTWDSQEGVKCD